LFQPGIIPVFVVAFVTIVAATTDIWKYKVYNWLTFPTLICGLIYWLFAAGLSGVGMSFAGLFVGFGSLVVFYALGGVGAGDVKLLAAIGAWLGPLFTMNVLLGSVFAAGLYALGLTVLRGGILATIVEITVQWQRLIKPSEWTRPSARVESVVLMSDRRRRLVPFAAMICVGFFATTIWRHAELLPNWSRRELAASTPTNAPHQRTLEIGGRS
jgi:prepilin peptidase CpaA